MDTCVYSMPVCDDLLLLDVFVILFNSDFIFIPGAKAESENVPLLNAYKNKDINCESKKRRNPFGTESLASPTKKRSVLNSSNNDNNYVCALIPGKNVDCEDGNPPDVSPKSTSRGNKLIEELQFMDHKTVKSFSFLSVRVNLTFLLVASRSS